MDDVARLPEDRSAKQVNGPAARRVLLEVVDMSLLRSARWISLFLAGMALSGCAPEVDVVPVPTASEGHFADDGGIQLAVGETLRVEMYAVRLGYSTEEISCSNDSTLTSNDPSVVAVSATHTNEALDDGAGSEALVFTLTGVRAGDASLDADCTGRRSAPIVHVR